MRGFLYEFPPVRDPPGDELSAPNQSYSCLSGYQRDRAVRSRSCGYSKL